MNADATDPAKLRFQLIALMRLYGLALVVLGFVLWRTDWLGFTHPRVGRITVAAGVGVLTILPALLRRRWRRDRVAPEPRG